MNRRLIGSSVLFLAMLISLPNFVGCSPSKEEGSDVTPLKAAGPNEVVKVFAVKGMTCEGCEQHVCENLQAVPGVKTAKASHVANKAWVVVDKAGPSNDALVTAIKQSGDEYKVEPIDK